MRRRAAMVALAAGLLLGAGPAEADKGRLMGIWVLVSAEEKGRQIPTPTIVASNHRMIFEKDGYTDMFRDQKKLVVHRGTYKLDASKSPKEIDLAPTRGKKAGPTFRAIYDLNGDLLRICTYLDGKARPSMFASVDSAVCIFQREKASR